MAVVNVERVNLVKLYIQEQENVKGVQKERTFLPQSTVNTRVARRGAPRSVPKALSRSKNVCAKMERWKLKMDNVWFVHLDILVKILPVNHVRLEHSRPTKVKPRAPRVHRSERRHRRPVHPP